MPTKKKKVEEEVVKNDEMNFDDEVVETSEEKIIKPVEKECVYCHKKFVVSPAEQNFFKSKGYEIPKRCPDCREMKKKEETFKCVDCGAKFKLRGSEINFYKESGYEIPKRCPSCREFKKIRNERYGKKGDQK